jgi:hypothetical protein
MTTITDTAEYEVEVVSEYLSYARIRRSDSEYIITTSPVDMIEPYLEQLEAEGFRPAGPVRLVAPGKTLVPYRRERTGPVTVAELIERLKKFKPNAPVTLAIQPLHRGPLVADLEVVYRTADTVELRGRHKNDSK